MNRRNRKVIKWLKDYIVPLVLVGIIFVIILSFIFWWNDKDNRIEDKFESLQVFNVWEGVNANLISVSWSKKAISWNTSINIWEKIEVISWNLKFQNSSWNILFNLNRLWEILYNGKNDFVFYSSDLFIEAREPFKIKMRYANLSWSNWVFSITQNEVASTIYALSWEILVSNLWWSEVKLTKWNYITILRNDANDKDINLSERVLEITDRLYNDTWFTLNNADKFLNSSNDDNQITENNDINLNKSFSFISFDNIQDETEVLTSSIDIRWNILHEKVDSIEINWIKWSINLNSWTFEFKNFNLNSLTNDLIFKVYDNSWNILDKWVITLYNPSWIKSSNTINQSGLAWVINFALWNSPNYQILSPAENPFITEEKVVRIEWKVPPWTVHKITVNDFQLTKFPRNGTYWQYFANSEYGNLKNWINLYNIKYFWAEDKLLYEDNFLIIKK